MDYLFLDGSCFKLHRGARAKPVLAAWGITTEGKPVFLGLASGASESTDAWSDFLEELKGRGLRSPLLIISDGAGGLINAAETSFARSLRQRCLIHRARNLLAKVPTHAQGEVKAAYWQVFDTDDVDLEPGPQLVALVQARIDAFAEHYRPSYPSAVKCLLADREQLTAYLRFPAEHHKRIRHSNFIERTFGETRRRVKVIGRLPGEASCLSLVWAVLDRASRGWRGFTMTASGYACYRIYATRCLTHPLACDPTHPRPTRRAPKLSEPPPNLSMRANQRPSIYTEPGTPPILSADVARRLAFFP